MKTVWLLDYRHFKIFLYQHILVFIPPAVTFHRFFRHFISQKESLSVIISVICKSKFCKLLTRVLIPWNSCCLNLFWDYIMNFSTTCQFFSKRHISVEARVYYYVCSSLSNFDILDGILVIVIYSYSYTKLCVLCDKRFVLEFNN